MHYSKFDNKAGQIHWREQINEALRNYGEGFELNESGEIQRLGSPGLQDVLTSRVPQTTDENEQKIASAIHRFRLAKSTRKDRQDAVRDLADVLEFYRSEVKKHLPKKDEAALFEIANNFAIRHHNQVQQGDYSDAWLNWLFYLYLSSVRLMLELLEQTTKNEDAANEALLISDDADIPF